MESFFNPLDNQVSLCFSKTRYLSVVFTLYTHTYVQQLLKKNLSLTTRHNTYVCE